MLGFLQQVQQYIFVLFEYHHQVGNDLQCCLVDGQVRELVALLLQFVDCFSGRGRVDGKGYPNKSGCIAIYHPEQWVERWVKMKNGP